MTILEAVKQSKTPALMHKGSIKKAQDMLQPDEVVLWAMTVNVCTDPSANPASLTLKEMENVLLVVTDQRIFYVKKVLSICSSSFIPLWEIRSVSERPSGVSRYLQIKSITKYLLIEGHIKTIPPLHNAIQNALAKYASPAPASAPDRKSVV